MAAEQRLRLAEPTVEDRSTVASPRRLPAHRERKWHEAGHRDQRTNGHGGTRLCRAGGRSCAGTGVTRDDVRHARSDPDLFVAAIERLDLPMETAIDGGGSIRDMLTARDCRALDATPAVRWLRPGRA
jgi:hypothetical protein